jgi:hypothetical protein
MSGDPLANFVAHGPDKLITLQEMADILGTTSNRVYGWCTRGKLSDANGNVIKLERWQTEFGWASSQQALVRFRQRLNDPLYSPMAY